MFPKSMQFVNMVSLCCTGITGSTSILVEVKCRQHCRLSICWYFDWVWPIQHQTSRSKLLLCYCQTRSLVQWNVVAGSVFPSRSSAEKLHLGAGLVGLSHFHNDKKARCPEISIHAVNVNVGICFSSISVALTYGKCDNLICTYLCLNVVVE